MKQHHWYPGVWCHEDFNQSFAHIMPGAVIGRQPIGTAAIDGQPAPDLQAPVFGDGCVIGANAVIYADVVMGNNCLIGDTACIREGARIGDNVLVAMGVTFNRNATIGSRVRILDNAHITSYMVVEDDVFIGPGVMTMNDNSMAFGAELKPPIVRAGALIGGGALLLPGVKIGAGARVAAGAVVTRDVAPGQVVFGSPARVRPMAKGSPYEPRQTPKL